MNEDIVSGHIAEVMGVTSYRDKTAAEYFPAQAGNALVFSAT